MRDVLASASLKRKIIFKPFTRFLEKRWLDIFPEGKKGKEGRFYYVFRYVSERQHQFSWEICLGSYMYYLFAMMFDEIEIVQLVPDKKIILNEDTLRANLVEKGTWGHACKRKCEKNKSENDHHEHVLGEQKQNDLDSDGDKKGIHKVLTASLSKRSACCMPGENCMDVVVIDCFYFFSRWFMVFMGLFLFVFLMFGGGHIFTVND